MGKYQHMKDGFPYLDNVDVYEYTNNYDYTKWGIGTVLRVLHVPWDRDYNNVVKFTNDTSRDEWAKNHTEQIYKLDTAINIQADGVIKLPVPFDVLAKCNYIVVEYAYADINYEKPDRIAKMGYFIEDVMQLAPSTTQARVSIDFWYTFINNIDISYMDLERGHAPMAAIKADQYLSDPINNNTYLLTPDVNFSTDERNRIKQAAEWIANDGDCYAIFATTGNTGSSNWGSNGNRNMETPAVYTGQFFGIASGLDYIAVSASDLTTFISNCNAFRPHFLQTVQAMFFAPAKLVDVISTLSWDNFEIDIYWINTTPKNYNVVTLNKSMFNYDNNYKDIAKLYTAPYCHLEVTDENGNVSRIDVENTTGKLNINATLNLVHPFLGLDVILIGAGGSDITTSSFEWTGSRSFSHAGDWYTTIKHYNIPSYIVSQSQNDRAQFDRFFTNAQSVNDYTTSYNNSTASNATAYSNTTASNATGYDNTTASNTTNYNNTLASNNASFSNTSSQALSSYMNTAASLQTALDNAILANDYAYSDGINAVIVNDTAYGNQVANNLITTINGGVNTIAGTVSSAATGNAAGAVSGAIGTVTGIASYPLLLSNDYDTYKASRDAAMAHLDSYYSLQAQQGTSGLGEITANAVKSTQDSNNLRNKNTTDTIASTNKTMGDGNALATKNTGDANALRTKNTGDANALRTKNTGDANAGRTRDNSIAAIDNGNRAQGVSAPATYGSTNNASTATTRPIGLFVNVATQSKAAIKAAGDQFCRYGYMLDQAWSPESLQVMKYFTYWKTRDLWISNRGNTIQNATEIIKAIFENGVTVWDDPDRIGRVSIYDNMR